MKSTVRLFLGLFLGLVRVIPVSPQNIVRNGSFEEHIGCVYDYLKDLNSCDFNPLARSVVDGWFTPADRRADYFHPCNTAPDYRLPKTRYGHVYPADGEACVGIWFYRDMEGSASRDYLIGTLTEPLQAGKTYFVSYKVRLSEHSQLAGPAPGLWVTDRKMRPSDLSVGFSAREPQVNPDTAFFIWDKTRWYTIEGKFRAEGGERYVVLGYFGKKKDPPLIYLRDRRTEGLLPECYYLIDDVYLGLEPPPERNHTRPAPRPVDYVPFRRGFQWIEGTVTDRLTGNPLPGAEVLVYELGHPEKAERVQLTRQGSFRVAVPRGKYVIVGRHKGYLPRALYSESTVYEESLEIKLTEVKKGHKMPLLNFYTYQDGALRFHRFAPEELREVASYLADHPNVKIQVNSQGYRQRGKQESEEDVMYETEARSKEIMDFLVEAGALGYQVAARGYGLSRGAGYLDEIEITDILPLPDNRPRFPLTVVLRNAQTQKIVPGTFNLVHQERGTVRVVENPEGRVTVKIHPGTYLLSVAAPGYLPVVENVAMPLDAHEVTILLHPIENNSFTLRNISFPPNSFSPDSSSYPILDQVAELLRQRPDISLSIEGHTDGSNERTTDEYLNELSLRRAEGVKAYLVAKGIDPARLQCIGYGRSKPVASNDTPEGRALNRRIEFRIIE